MPDLHDVRRIILTLPAAEAAEDLQAFSVPHKGKARAIAWVWRERVHPKKTKVPNQRVIAVHVSDLGEKEFLLDAHPEAIFTEPHYDGYPAILVRLDVIDEPLLTTLLTNAWRYRINA